MQSVPASNQVALAVEARSGANPVPGRAFRLKGSISGNVLTLDLDGVPKVSALDPNVPLGSGSVGLYIATGSGPNRSYVADNFSALAE